jgi:phospholipid-binding lipoprotein MlaA
MTRIARALLAFACASVVGCASSPSGRPDARDPFERVNRATYRFNDAVDRAVLKPVAKGYQRIAPQFVETGVGNFMDNLGYPVVLANELLQGKLGPALNDTGRLLLNTTLGIGGLLDPASAAGLDKNDEDFGQTLGKWGVPSGAYLVLPFLGPSTVRDGFGLAVDQFADPRTYIEEDEVRLPIQGLRIIDRRARLLSLEETLNQAYDRYAFLRNAYLQRREYLVTDGAVADEPLDEEAMLEESGDEPAAPPPP